MALSIPIISTFDNKGISKAIKSFRQLETNGERASFALKKAAIPATAAIAGLGAALFSATKDAMADQAAQALLAKTLQKATGATDAQIKANEDWISVQGKLLGISDDELRPAINSLAKVTGSVTKAQKLATAAMDIAASTGKPLATVTTALAKAYGGNLTALAKLSPQLRQMIKDGASFEEVMAAMAKTTGGAAAVAANTTEGKMKRLAVAMKETKESIGNSLLPVFEKLLPYLQKFADWAEKNPGKITAIAIAFGVLSAAVVVMNAAMALNPVGLIVIGIAALIAGLVYAYKKFEGFRKIVDALFGAIKWWINNVTIPAFQTLLNVAKTIFNAIAGLWNDTFGKMAFKIPSWVPLIGGNKFEVPDIPQLAKGGIVTSPQLALIGEKGPEAVIPLSKMDGMGGGVHVTVQTGIGDPVAIGKAVSDVLNAYNRRTGNMAA